MVRMCFINKLSEFISVGSVVRNIEFRLWVRIFTIGLVDRVNSKDGIDGRWRWL